MGGTAPGEMPERDDRAPCEFYRQFFWVRQVPAVFVTIKKGDIRAFLEEKNSRILPGDGGAQVALQENTLAGEAARFSSYPEERGGFAAETEYLPCGVF